MTDGREPNFKNMAPRGYCDTCKMAKINRGGEAVCPNCASKSTTRSGLRSTVQDPGDNMDASGNIKGGIKGGVVYDPDVTNKLPETDRVESIPVSRSASPSAKSISYLNLAEKELDNFKLSDFKDLRSARKVMTLKKKIAVLKLDVESLGG